MVRRAAWSSRTYRQRRRTTRARASSLNVSGPWVDEVLEARGARAREATDRRDEGKPHRRRRASTGAPARGALRRGAGRTAAPSSSSPGTASYLIGTTDCALRRQTWTRSQADERRDRLPTARDEPRPSCGAAHARDVLYTYSGVRPLPSARGATDGGDHAPPLHTRSRAGARRPPLHRRRQADDLPQSVGAGRGRSL